MNDQIILKDKIEEYIKINDLYLRKMDEFYAIRNKKNELEENINNQLQDMNLENKTFVLNHTKIQQKTVTNYQQFSMKYINDCLQNIVDESKIEEIIHVLKNNRTKKIKKELKLSLNE